MGFMGFAGFGVKGFFRRVWGEGYVGSIGHLQG